MTGYETIAAAEAAALATPHEAALSHAPPCLAVPCHSMQSIAPPSGEAEVTDPRPYFKKLDRVLDRMGRLYTWQDIMERLSDGRMQSFAHGNSLAVTEVAIFPRARVLDIILAVGDLKDCRALHDEVVRFADKLDIPLIRAHGRRGWMPDARDHGWRTLTTSYVYVKEL